MRKADTSQVDFDMKKSCSISLQFKGQIEPKPDFQTVSVYEDLDRYSKDFE